jgi:hypothetical protein
VTNEEGITMWLRKTVVLCLIAVMLGSCAGRARNVTPSCSVPAVGACKPCRIACPTPQTPKCVAGQGDETSCNQPASCTCASQ